MANGNGKTLLFNPVEKNLGVIVYGAKKNPLETLLSEAAYDQQVIEPTRAHIETSIRDAETQRVMNVLSESDRSRGPHREMISTCGNTHPLNALVPIIGAWDPDQLIVRYFKNGLDLRNSPKVFPRTVRTVVEKIQALGNGHKIGEAYDVIGELLDPDSYLLSLTRKGIKYEPTPDEISRLGAHKHLYVAYFVNPDETLDNDPHLDGIADIVEKTMRHPDLKFSRNNFPVKVDDKMMEGKSLVVLYPNGDFGLHESPEPHYRFKSMNLSTDNNTSPLELLVPMTRHHVINGKKPAAFVARYFADPHGELSANGDMQLARIALEELGYHVEIQQLIAKKFRQESIEFRIAGYDPNLLSTDQVRAFLDRYDTSTLVPEPEPAEATRAA